MVLCRYSCLVDLSTLRGSEGTRYFYCLYLYYTTFCIKYINLFSTILLYFSYLLVSVDDLIFKRGSENRAMESTYRCTLFLRVCTYMSPFQEKLLNCSRGHAQYKSAPPTPLYPGLLSPCYLSCIVCRVLRITSLVGVALFWCKWCQTQ